MRQRYGDAVSTEFVNLASTENRDRYPQVLEAIKSHNLPLPLVAINGEVKVAGGVDYYAITRALDTVMGTPQAA